MTVFDAEFWMICWWTVLTPPLRHRLLEALRVASDWRHNNATHVAKPVLPYARLAFTHTLSFLNKVGFVPTHACTNQFIGNKINLSFKLVIVSVFVCADGPDAHAGRERGAGSCWSGAVGRDEVRQIQGTQCLWESYLRVCVYVCNPLPSIPLPSISASFSETTYALSWVHSCGGWGPTPVAAATSFATAMGAAPGDAPARVSCSPQLQPWPLITSCVGATKAGAARTVKWRRAKTDPNQSNPNQGHFSRCEASTLLQLIN